VRGKVKQKRVGEDGYAKAGGHRGRKAEQTLRAVRNRTIWPLTQEYFETRDPKMVRKQDWEDST
jgi:hypothetical protein